MARGTCPGHQLRQLLNSSYPLQRYCIVESDSTALPVLTPLHMSWCRYGEMEGRQLAAELAAVPLPDSAAGPPETEAVVAGLGAATAPAAAAVLAAAERASQLTGHARRVIWRH